jgi:molybdate transport system ATP-binding protein
MTEIEIDVKVHAGAFELEVALHADGPTVLIGPNGSGKSTLLRTIAGALAPHRGHIRVGDHVLVDTSSGTFEPPERRRVGYVPQGLGLFPNMTVIENVAFGLRFGGGVGRDRAHERAVDMLDELGVANLKDRRVGQLSGGERQRVALARALATDPAILLLDEPLSALDVTARRDVRVFLRRWLERFAGPFILVTHDVRDLSTVDAPVVVLEAGSVVQSGRLDALEAAPANAFVREFTMAP